MFAYADPVGRNFLGNVAAETAFRQSLEGTYDGFARRVDSAFTWLEAFSQLSAGQTPTPVTVEWPAFPLTASTSDTNIDTDRFRHQDEYVEWRIEKSGNTLTKVTFTTEFPEYYEAFAAVGFDALKAAIQDAIPEATPTPADLFGAGFSPAAQTALARAQTFRGNLQANPWNNGQKGILCLTQRFNTLDALFNLLTECGVLKTQGTPEGTCSLVGGACGPGRNSDPTICTRSQKAVRAKLGYTLRDPGGVRVLRLSGIWTINGTVLDINSPANNQGVWAVSRNGRRAVLTISTGLKLDGQVLVTGAQVSRALHVAADLLTAPDDALPDWARIGAESGSRGPA
jgi:hypothetical protein